jgi:hypothetical protein
MTCCPRISRCGSDGITLRSGRIHARWNLSRGRRQARLEALDLGPLTRLEGGDGHVGLRLVTLDLQFVGPLSGIAWGKAVTLVRPIRHRPRCGELDRAIDQG